MSAVFSGWLDELVVKALEPRAKRAREQQRRVQCQDERGVQLLAEEISRDAMLETLRESTTLRSVASVPQVAPVVQLRPTPAAAPEDYLRRLDVRSQVEALADELGREPADVLQALGRSSMRDLEVGDRDRLGKVFLQLRDAHAACSPSRKVIALSE